MDTITRHTRTLPDVAPDPDRLGFDDRLMMASIGIDTVIDHKHSDVLADSRDAVREAIEAAELLNPEDPQFKPHPVLAKARRIIEDVGWNTGCWQSPDGAVCAQFAIHLAAPNGAAEVFALEELMNRIAADTGRTMSVPMWNDRAESKDVVLRLLY